jgi:hypothetical protein
MNKGIITSIFVGLCLAGIAKAQPEIAWSRTYGGINREVCYSVVRQVSGGFALAGYTESFEARRRDFWLVMADSMGEPDMSNIFSGPDVDGCWSLLQTEDGGFSLAGYTTGNGANGQDFWMVDAAQDGRLNWSCTYGGRSGESCNSHIQTADGGFALAGWAESFGAGGSDFWLVRTNVDGDSLSSFTFGGSSNDRCWAIIQTTDGGFALAGYSQSFGDGDSQM